MWCAGMYAMCEYVYMWVYLLLHFDPVRFKPKNSKKAPYSCEGYAHALAARNGIIESLRPLLYLTESLKIKF
jgi:hypothetical protein